MRLLAILWVALLTAIVAHADEVAVEWQAEEGAAQYELQVKRESHVVFDSRFPRGQTRWRGNLPYGSYAYQLRTLDAAGRMGPWSDPVAFVVMPAPPQLFAPADGTTILYKIGKPIGFRWSRVPGVERYEIAIRTPSGTVKKIVRGTTLALPDLIPGEYAWQAKPILSEKSAGQATVLESKASAVSRFRLDLVKDAEKYGEDYQRITLMTPSAGTPFEVSDYLCLYSADDPSAGPVACGKISQKGEQSIGMNLAVQQRRISDGGKYYLASPMRSSRGPASFTSSNTYQISSERGRFNFDVNAGITVGANYFFPAFEVQAAVLPGFALGLRYFMAGEEQNGASLSLYGFYLTFTKYFGRKNFTGFFAQAGLGDWSFSATKNGAEQPNRISLAGEGAIGWQLRPPSQGLNATFSLGAQYVSDPKVTLATTRLRGWLPMVTVLFGYSF